MEHIREAMDSAKDIAALFKNLEGVISLLKGGAVGPNAASLTGPQIQSKEEGVIEV